PAPTCSWSTSSKNGNEQSVGSQIVPGIWTGSPEGAEALYVWNLLIQPDANIDFGGLHLYYETGASMGFGPDPSVWFADLALWEAQGDVFVGAERLLISMGLAGSLPEPSSLVMMATALACASACARSRRCWTAREACS